MRSRAAPQLLDRFFGAFSRRAVGRVDHPVIGLDNRNDARKQGYFRFLQAFLITGAVPVFVMGQDRFRQFQRVAEVVEYPVSHDGMLLDLVPFGGTKAVAFFKAGFKDDLSDVVQASRFGKPLDVGFGQPQRPAKLLAQLADPRGVQAFLFVELRTAR